MHQGVKERHQVFPVCYLFLFSARKRTNAIQIAHLILPTGNSLLLTVTCFQTASLAKVPAQ